MKNRTQNMVERLFPDPFLENKNWEYLWINRRNFRTVFLHCMSKSRAIEIYWNYGAYHWLFPHINLFLKAKRIWNLSLCLIFCMIFEEKYSSHYILLTGQMSLSGCLSSWDIGQYMYCNCFFTSLWRHKCWN